MRNIFSYKLDSIFTGKEIMDYCKYQIQNNGSHAKEAKRIYLHYNLKDNKLYKLDRLPFGPGTDQCRYGGEKLGFVRVNK